MSFELLDFLLRAVPILISIVALVAAGMSRRNKDVEDRFGVLEGRSEKLERQQDRIEERLRLVPEQADLHRVDLRITEMSGVLNGIGATLDAQKQVLDRLDAVVTRQDDYLRGLGK